MWHSRFSGLVGPRRQDPKIAISLQTIRVDNRTAERSGQFERERRFAARCWSGDYEDRRRTASARVSPLVTGPTGGVGGR